MAKRKPTPTDPVTAYAQAVVAGEIVTGELVRLACERHLRDLVDGPARGIVWSVEHVEQIIGFFALLRHSKGRWAGKPFTLDPWQVFFAGSLWGWRREDGTRRFRLGHLEVARKNGKTTLAAGLALALLLLDGEAGAEVYCCATKKDQAKITHSEAERMVKASTALKKRIKNFKNNLSVESTGSKCEPLSSASEKLDGLNVSGAVCDEIHAWTDRHLWDVIETATGAREQPLRIGTTTAGYNLKTIWGEIRKAVIAAIKAISSSHHGFNDAIFGVIYTLDEDDDWTDENVWIKGNPNLGVTLKIEDLRAECQAALASPGKQPAFRRLRVNQITEASAACFDMRRWDECEAAVDTEALVGRTCYAAGDLSSNLDLTCVVYLFPPEDEDDETEPWILVARFWLPDEDLQERIDRDGVPYDQWAEDGYIELIPGRVIRYPFVKAAVLEDAARYKIIQLGFDPWNATQVATELADEGVEVIGFRQGYASMNPALKEFERLLVDGRFRHSGNPVLRWCVANVAATQDAAGNRKPDKSKSTGRIDGAVAAIMAAGLAAVGEGGSVYDQGESLEL